MTELNASWVNDVTIRTPFSPTILEYQVPQRFIDIINTSGDAVLPDDGLSKKSAGNARQLEESLETTGGKIPHSELGTRYVNPANQLYSIGSTPPFIVTQREFSSIVPPTHIV